DRGLIEHSGDPWIHISPLRCRAGHVLGEVVSRYQHILERRMMLVDAGIDDRNGDPGPGRERAAALKADRRLCGLRKIAVPDLIAREVDERGRGKGIQNPDRRLIEMETRWNFRRGRDRIDLDAGHCGVRTEL